MNDTPVKTPITPTTTAPVPAAMSTSVAPTAPETAVPIEQKKERTKAYVPLVTPVMSHPWFGLGLLLAAATLFFIGAWYVFVLYEKVSDKVTHVASEKLRADSLGELERLASSTAPSRAALPSYFAHEAELVDYIEILEATAVARNVHLDITSLDADIKPDRNSNGAAAAVVKTASTSRTAAPKFADAHLRFSLAGSWNDVLGMYRFIETMPLAMTLKEVHMYVADIAPGLGVNSLSSSGDELPLGPRRVVVPPPGRHTTSVVKTSTQWTLQGEMVIKITL